MGLIDQLTEYDFVRSVLRGETHRREVERENVSAGQALVQGDLAMFGVAGVNTTTSGALPFLSASLEASFVHLPSETPSKYMRGLPLWVDVNWICQAFFRPPRPLASHRTDLSQPSPRARAEALTRLRVAARRWYQRTTEW